MVILRTIVDVLNLQVRVGEDKLSVPVTGGYAGDLLSDVIANSEEGQIWITRQIHQNIVAVAGLKNLAGIILVRGSEPAADTLKKAAQEGIPMMVTDMSSFEVAGRIYNILRA